MAFLVAARVAQVVDALEQAALREGSDGNARASEGA